MDATHEIPRFLRLVIGGTDLDEYPGFNGLISRPIFRIGRGAFLGTVQDY